MLALHPLVGVGQTPSLQILFWKYLERSQITSRGHVVKILSKGREGQSDVGPMYPYQKRKIRGISTLFMGGAHLVFLLFLKFNFNLVFASGWGNVSGVFRCPFQLHLLFTHQNDHNVLNLHRESGSACVHFWSSDAVLPEQARARLVLATRPVRGTTIPRAFSSTQA